MTVSEEDLKKIEAYFETELGYQKAMGLVVTGAQSTAPLVAQLIELHRRQTAEVSSRHRQPTLP